MAIKDPQQDRPSTVTIPEYPSSTPPSILLLILDLHPLSWSLLAQPPPADPGSSGGSGGGDAGTALENKVPYTSLSLDDFLNVLLVFLNAVMASSGANQVAVYGATAGRAKMLYPPPYDPASEAGAGAGPRSNSYEPFRMLDTRIEEGLRGMAEEEKARIEQTGGQGMNDPPAIVSALTKALCHVNRLSPPSTHSSSLTAGDATIAQTTPDRIEPRILIINATPGSQSSSGGGSGGDGDTGGGGGGRMKGGYVGLMNCVFAAQKAKVPIDVLSLPPPYTHTSPPIFLQQASHLTDGVYWRWNGKGGLLQYLHTIYLPPPSLRRIAFSVPPQDAVDYRAVCFCHGDVVDVGFVCSVCLSIFCKPIPVCQMCRTRFPIKALPTLRAMAENIVPIPVPDIVVPPPMPKTGRKGSRSAPMEVD